MKSSGRGTNFLTTMAVFLNDRFFEDQEAQLPISDLSIQRGYAAFDFFRTEEGHPLFLADHLSRFYASAESLGLKVKQTQDELKSIIAELIRRCRYPESGVRLMLSGGYSPDGFHVAEPNLLLSCKSLRTANLEDFERGIKIISYAHQRELPHIKSINYQMAVWLQPKLREMNVDDVLYHHNGLITEFPRANIFMVSAKKVLLTPAKNMLEGITRKKILALAEGQMAVEVRDVELSELEQASEIFLTSTTKKLMPVVQVNGKMIGDGKPGPVTRRLYGLFLKCTQET